ncbi:MAG: chitin deacetylase family protein [Phormidesmis sp.]
MNNRRHKGNGRKSQGVYWRALFGWPMRWPVRWLAVGAIASILILALLSQPRWIFRLATQLMPGAIYAVDLPASQKTVALTIDDGPSAATADILNTLAKHSVKATFFNISGNLPDHEAIVQQAVSSGHELGNHLTADYPSIRLSPADFEASLLTADRALSPFLQTAHLLPTARPATATNLQTNLHWLRPGMGFYDQAMVKTAQRHGYRLVLGSVFPYDTHLPSSRFASAFILSTVRPGDIIVLHDGLERGRRTAQTLAKILPALQARGYAVTTVTQLMSSS